MTPRLSSTDAPSRRVGIVYNPEKEKARQERTKLTGWLRARGYQVMVSERVTSALAKARLVIALGGDGTVLRVARGMAPFGVPVLGINVGRLGFLAATEWGAAFQTLSRVLAGKIPVDERMVLSVTARLGNREEGPYLALNDCVLRSASAGRIVPLKLEVDGKLLSLYHGDGLIVSTPTGSTAYSLAASGPIVHPALRVLMVTPICPHTLAQRPLIIPPEAVITVRVPAGNPPAMLCLDGQVTFPLKKGDSVVVRSAREKARLYSNSRHTYFELLQTKLNWGD